MAGPGVLIRVLTYSPSPPREGTVTGSGLSSLQALEVTQKESNAES